MVINIGQYLIELFWIVMWAYFDQFFYPIIQLDRPYLTIVLPERINKFFLFPITAFLFHS